MITLVLKPHNRLNVYDAYLDGTLLVTSRQPRLDGARKLLEMGHSPDTLLTIRHEGKAYDSFHPAPIGELAQWTIEESDKGGLRRRKWQPFGADRGLPFHAQNAVSSRGVGSQGSDMALAVGDA